MLSPLRRFRPITNLQIRKETTGAYIISCQILSKLIAAEYTGSLLAYKLQYYYLGWPAPHTTTSLIHTKKEDRGQRQHIEWTVPSYWKLNRAPAWLIIDCKNARGKKKRYMRKIPRQF